MTGVFGSVFSVMVLCSMVPVNWGYLEFPACLNSFIHLSCVKGETLEVKQLDIIDDYEDSCPGGYNDPELSSSYPDVPQSMRQFCPEGARFCLYEESICDGKSDCVFYIGKTGGRLKGRGKVRIQYACSGNMSRQGGIAGFLIVTAALGITMVTIVFMLIRSSRTTEDRYVEFENRLSRSPSMTSEVGSKAVARIKDIENGRGQADGGFTNPVAMVSDEQPPGNAQTTI